MRLSDHAAAVSLVAMPRVSRAVLSSPVLPLIVFTLGVGGLLRHGPEGPARAVGPDRLGRMSREEVVARAKDLCARLTSEPCEVGRADARDVTLPARSGATGAPGWRRPPHEWYVVCTTPSGHCSLRFDADARELRAFGREGGAVSGAAPLRSVAAALSAGESERIARRCLDRARLPLPAGARPVRSLRGNVEYRLRTDGSGSRLIGVRLNPANRRLYYLTNVVVARPVVPISNNLSRGLPPGGPSPRR
jgi:hypothetical protein